MCLAGAILLPAVGLGQNPPPAPTPTAQVQTGRIAGRVIDVATGRPLAASRIVILPMTGALQTDLDGRFRSSPLPVGIYSVRAAQIGYRMRQVDSLRVVSGETAVVTFALDVVAVEIAELVAVAEVPVRAASDEGLLAQQKTAASVSDGISAETIRRTPDSKASNAVTRITGVSVVNNFVIVRGLNERYSGTLLNGSELPSPEPLKRVVPLDVFPARLLESIVVTKGATPDKPGDFAGGLVEIRTKEFPDEFVAETRIGFGYNSTTTFEPVRTIPRGGTDFLGIDDGRRAMPAPPNGSTISRELFGESVRRVWTPAPQEAGPNLGLEFYTGGQRPLGSGAIGTVFSLTYLSKTESQPDRLFQFIEDTEGTRVAKGYVYQDAQSVVDWGGIFNVSARLGGSTKLGWKNFYSRNAEESVFQSTGFETDRGENGLFRYQVRYIERDLLQSQLSGEHLLSFLGDLRLEWRAAAALANRDEPDNRNLTYIPEGGTPTLQSALKNYLWFRFLDDRSLSGQVDASLPFSLRQNHDAFIQVGVAARRKDRTFEADLYSFTPVVTPPDGRQAFQLPPEQALAPENIGRNVLLEPSGLVSQSYEVTDDLNAAYAMIDLEPIRGVRLIGGLRFEEWLLDLYLNTRDNPVGEPTVRRERDYLWSGNLTIGLSDRMQVRLGAANTVSRPDSREMSPDQYEPVGGECVYQGNPDLLSSDILNGDLRWEYYPRPGELIAVSGFYKRFDNPVVETVDSFGNGNCRITYRNADEATNYGVELEVRRRLEFLPGILSNLQASTNLTVVSSSAILGEGFSAGDTEIPLMGQSPFLVNGSLGYLDSGNGFELSALVNYFDDRVVRYGVFLGSVQVPNVTEKGRVTLDAKLFKALGRFGLTLAGKNLTNANYSLYQDSATGPVLTGFSRPGVTFSMELGYDF